MVNPFGRTILVNDFASERDFLDISYTDEAQYQSESDELRTYRALNRLVQEHPFVTFSIDVIGGTIYTTVGACQELPVDAADRAEKADKYVDSLLAALDEFISDASSQRQNAA
jgi:hypothetical protein